MSKLTIILLSVLVSAATASILPVIFPTRTVSAHPTQEIMDILSDTTTYETDISEACAVVQESESKAYCAKEGF